MALFPEQNSGGIGVKNAFPAKKIPVINSAVSGTNKTVVGAVYALDTLGGTATTLAGALTRMVASAAGHLTNGIFVVAQDAKLVNANMLVDVLGSTKALVYGTVAMGDMLVPDTTNARFIKTTTHSEHTAIAGAARTGTATASIIDVLLVNRLV